jgi:GDPmannose 4,6-dehydratase
MRANRHEHADEYVIATGTAHSVREFAVLALEAARVTEPESRLTIDPELLRHGDAPALIGDASKARSVLGWVPTMELREIVSAMVAEDFSLVAPGAHDPHQPSSEG